MKKIYALTITVTLFTNTIFAQLSLLNDEFNSASSLSNWSNLNITEGWNLNRFQFLNINTATSDKLVMIPLTVSWYNEYRGPLLYKTVTGDFTLTTEVTVTNRNQNGIPSSTYSLAGLMVRAPRSITNGQGDWTPNGENYVFLATGHASANHPTANNAPAPHFEVKNTVNSSSDLEVSAIGSQTMVIRMVRVGDAIIALRKTPTGDFVVHKRYHRPDLPATLQVGFVTYTDWDKLSTYTPNFHNNNVLVPGLVSDPSNNPSLPFNPDLRAEFEYARFTEVSVPSNLTGVDLVNTATDNELLSFLGFPSTPNTPTGINNSEYVENKITTVVNNELIINNELIGKPFKIFNINGKAVYSGINQNLAIDISYLAKGVYIAVFEINSKPVSFQFIKQ